MNQYLWARIMGRDHGRRRVDSALGQTTLLAETPHLIAVAGWALLAARAKGTQPNRPAGSSGHGEQP
jgi:hypothetical protein